MGLRFENSFIVKATPDRVWAYLTDPSRVAPALPGAAITGKGDDGSYGGTITIKVGPVSARYKGTVRFETLDPAARRAVMVAKGQDVSGRGGADMRMESRLVEKSASETEATVVSDVNVTGILAQFGRGLMQDVSDQMFQRFTQAVRAELESESEPQPPSSSPPSSLAAPASSAAPASGAATSASASAAAAAPRPAPAPAPPIEVISFGSKLLARAGGRMIRRPVFWVAVAALAGLVYWVSR